MYKEFGANEAHF